MEKTMNKMKRIDKESSINLIVEYVKGKYGFISEESYNNSETNMLTFIDKEDELTYVLDIYPKNPNHFRMYLLFDDEFSLEKLNKVNASIRIAKGTTISIKNKKCTCVEVELMLFGNQNKLTAEAFLEKSKECIVDFVKELSEDE